MLFEHVDSAVVSIHVSDHYRTWCAGDDIAMFTSQQGKKMSWQER